MKSLLPIVALILCSCTLGPSRGAIVANGVLTDAELVQKALSKWDCMFKSRPPFKVVKVRGIVKSKNGGIRAGRFLAPDTLEIYPDALNIRYYNDAFIMTMLHELIHSALPKVPHDDGIYSIFSSEVEYKSPEISERVYFMVGLMMGGTRKKPDECGFRKSF